MIDRNTREQLLLELGSAHRQTRLAAILQLSNCRYIPAVRQAVQAQLDRETDDECRYYLQSMLPGVATPGVATPGARTSGTDERPPTASATAGPATATLDEVTEAAFVERYRCADAAGRAHLRHQLERERSWQYAVLLTELLTRERFPDRIAELLELPDALFKEAPAPQALAGLLRHAEFRVVLRALQILGRVAPETTLPALPILLKHRSTPVRSMAVRLLFRLDPGEALRLLGELTSSDDPMSFALGLNLLFQFPFDAITGPVTDLITSGRAAGAAQDALANLLANNPDRGLLLRLCRLVVRRPDDAEMLKPWLVQAATALVVSGLETGSADAVLARFLERATTEATPAPAPELALPITQTAPGAADPSDATRTRDAATTEATPATECRRFLAVPNPAAVDAATVPAITRLLTDGEACEDDVLLAIDAGLHGNCREPWFIKALTARLERAPDRVIVALMSALARVSPRDLHPHLPVLCRHTTPLVASQAVRHLRRLDKTPQLVQRIRAWLRETDPGAQRAAAAALMQIEFAAVRDLIIDTLARTRDQAQQEMLGHVLVMNPDYQAIFALRNLARQHEGARAQLLRTVADRCQGTLTTMNQGAPDEPTWITAARELTGRIGSGVALAQWTEEIRSISYATQAASASLWDDLAPTTRIGIALIPVALVILGLVLMRNPGPASGVGAPNPGSRPVKLAAPTPTELPADTIVFGTLQDYDPFNRRWTFATDDGGVFRLAGLAPDPAAFRPGARVGIRVRSAGITPLGYRLYQVTTAQALPGTPGNR